MFNVKPSLIYFSATGMFWVNENTLFKKLTFW